MCYCVICWLIYLLTLVWIDWSIDCEFVIEYLNVWWVDLLIGWLVDSLDISFSVAYLWFNYDLNDWLSARSIGLFVYTYVVYMCVCVDVIMYGLVGYLFYYWYVCMHVWMYKLAGTNWLIGIGCMNDWLRDCIWLVLLRGMLIFLTSDWIDCICLHLLILILLSSVWMFDGLIGWLADWLIVWIYHFLLHIYDLIMIWMIDWVLVRLVCLYTRMLYICVYVWM